MGVLDGRSADHHHHHHQLDAHGFVGFGEEGKQLAADLSQVEMLFGYSFVELEISFTIDLYPFFPPQVR